MLDSLITDAYAYEYWLLYLHRDYGVREFINIGKKSKIAANL